MKELLKLILINWRQHTQGVYITKFTVITCLLMFCILPNTLFSQTLTISELIKFRGMDNDDINDILVTKGWVFVGSENDRSTWAYMKSGSKANAWFKKYKNWENRISVNYVFCNTKGISTLKGQLVNQGFVKQNSETYNSMITSEYNNSDYEVSITYIANNSDAYDRECDAYSITLIKLKSLQEREKERREEERLRLLKEKSEKECEKSILKREERNRYFKNRVDSCNQLLDAIINAYYHSGGLAVVGEQISEEQRQDSIEAALRIADSLAAMEAAMMPFDSWMEPSPLPNKFGVTSKSIYVYSNPSSESKIKSCLYKNETVRIIDSIDDYYEIHFDYCSDDHYSNYTGYVKIAELSLIQKQPIKSNPKAKKKPVKK